MGESEPSCARQSHGARCVSCPVLSWPSRRETALAGSDMTGRSLALMDFASSARCLHDHPGGPVVWENR